MVYQIKYLGVIIILTFGDSEQISHSASLRLLFAFVVPGFRSWGKGVGSTRIVELHSICVYMH